MIIACPACNTRYAVPDAAIGSDGRTVRCAKCKHSWFQDPPTLDLVDSVESANPARAKPQPAAGPAADEVTSPQVQKPVPETSSPGPSINHWRTAEEPAAPAPPSSADGSVAARALRRGLAQNHQVDSEGPVSTRSDPSAPQAAREAPLSGEPDPPFDDEDDDGGSQFDYRAPFTRRHNTLRMWTFAAAIFAVLATGTIAAVNYYGLPDLVPLSRPTFGMGQPGLELDFPKTDMRTETMANGETIFRVRGTITNTARETLVAPNLLVVFSDEREREVGDWVVVPPKRQLAPGETVTVTEAISNVPRGAAAAYLGWAPN